MLTKGKLRDAICSALTLNCDAALVGVQMP
jgi:hypothetical protein